jgi:PAS domain S-box-containing protein
LRERLRETERRLREIERSLAEKSGILAATQAGLRRSEERYELATSAAAEGIYEWDVPAGSMFLTEQAKAFFAFSGEALTPNDWNVRVHPDDFAGYRDAIVEHFKGRARLLEHEYRIANADGSYRWVLDRGIGVRDASGRVVKVVGALSDITPRKRAEFELRQARDEAEEALAQQIATAGILRVISGSPTDVQPVFDAIVTSARRLCGATFSGVFLRGDDGLLRMVASEGLSPDETAIMQSGFPRPVGPDTVTGRAVLEHRVVHVRDMACDEAYAAAPGRRVGVRSILGVPMLRDDRAIGSVGVWRKEVAPFSDKQIALLKTFADQAVIAIENVRLFNGLEARNRDLTIALDQKTATSEILRVISSSPTDVQPVFDAIGKSAERLCGAEISVVSRVDGDLIRMVAVHGVNPQGNASIASYFPMRLDAWTVTARSIRDRAVVNIADVLADPDYEAKDAAMAGGYRGCLGVPMLREDQVIGAIFVARTTPGLFGDPQVELLKTFADQAVIAVENGRLFTELAARTAELTRSVNELRALGEVGQTVSSTLDLETVLATIVARATELAGMDGGALYEYDEAREEFHLHTTENLPAELADALRAAPIPKGEGAIGQLAVTGEPVEIRDIAGDRGYHSRVRETLIRLGFQSILAVPLLCEEHLLGGFVVCRRSAGAFAPEVIVLLRTFATQSALAIQNARLFREIDDKSRQLEAASRHKSEFLANMSHELRTPLNAIIGFSEILSERLFGDVNDKQAEYLADILESGRHLLSLINDILDLSKIEAGRMELDVAEFDLPSAIENTLTLVRERAQRRGIALGREIDARLATICGDERKVKQVLLNLLSNALKFTPEGGRIDVVAGLVDGSAEISVRDTGVGIAPEDQRAVFEEFRQVGTASKKVEGTGLGLAISRKFIELHGGGIRVESELGRGSTFTFTLPLVPRHPPPAGR